MPADKPKKLTKRRRQSLAIGGGTLIAVVVGVLMYLVGSG